MLEGLKRPALGLVLLMAALTVIFWQLDIRACFEPPYFFLSLNIIFIGFACLATAFIAGRSFLKTGAWPVLLVGAGALTFGLSQLIYSVISLPSWFNAGITAHHLNILAAGFLFLYSAFFTLNGVSPQANRRLHPGTLLQVYIGVIVFTALITIISLNGLLPPFFVQGTGGTTLQKVVSEASVLLLLLSSMIFWIMYRKSKSGILFWYAIGLFFLALGMMAAITTKVEGSPLSWMGRTSLYFSGISLLVAMLTVMQAAKTRQISMGDSMAALLSSTQAKLRETEEKYEELIRIAPSGIYEIDYRTQQFVSVNDTMCRITGYTREELLAMSPFDLMDQAGITQFRERIKDWRNGKTPQKNVEYKIRTKDGRSLYALLETQFINDENGNPKGALVIGHDITERKEAEEEIQRLMKSLQQEKDRLLTLINSIPDAVWFVGVDNKLQLVNPAASKEMGVESGNLEDVQKVGDTLEVFRPDGIRNSEEAAPPTRALKGETIINEEETVRFQDGSMRIRQVSASPVRDADGKIIGSIAVARDVTEQKKMEAALKESEQKYHALVETTSDFIWEMDVEGKYTYCSPQVEKLWGYKPEELIGKIPIEVLLPDEAPDHKRIFNEIVAAGKPFRGEIITYNRKHEAVDVEISGVPFFDAGGKLAGFRGISRDITERKKAQNALRESEEKFLIAFHSNPAAQTIATLPDGRWVEVNESFLNLIGYKREEVIGHTLTDFNLVDSGERTQIISHMKESSIQPQREVKVRRRDGKLLVLFTSNEKIMLNGKAHALSIMIDITERKRAEEKLHIFAEANALLLTSESPIKIIKTIAARVMKHLD